MLDDNTPQEPSTKRACDACRRRKIRCHGNGPGTECPDCIDINCACTYKISVRRRGPRKNSGRVIQSLQETAGLGSRQVQRQRPLQPPSPSPPHQPQQDQRQQTKPFDANIASDALIEPAALILCNEQQQQQSQRDGRPKPVEPLDTLSSSHTEIMARIWQLHEHLNVATCPGARDSVMSNGEDDDSLPDGSVLGLLYPKPPVLTQIELDALSPQADVPTDVHCLSTAIIAYTLLEHSSGAQMNPIPALRSRAWAETLLLEVSTLLNEKGPDPVLQDKNFNTPPETRGSSLCSSMSTSMPSRPSNLTAIAALLVMYHCYRLLARSDKAWGCLSRAAMVSWATGLHVKASYEGLSPMARVQHVDLYRLLYVVSSAEALKNKFIPTLPCNPELLDPDQEHMCSDMRYVESEDFGMLTKLYLACGDDIFGWSIPNDIFAPDMAALQQMHARIQQAYSLAGDESNELLAIDLRCTQVWLEIIGWEVAFRHGLLSANSDQEAHLFEFPFRAAQVMVDAFEAWDAKSARAHGTSLASKIFHVACACLDVVQCILPCENQQVDDPMRTLELLKTTLGRLGGAVSRLYISQLESKMMIASMLPPA